MIGDATVTVAGFLPDKAGPLALRETYDGTPGLRSGARGDRVVDGRALLAGAWSVRRRDA